MVIFATRLKGGMCIEFLVCMGIRRRKCFGMKKYMSYDISEITEILPYSARYVERVLWGW